MTASEFHALRLIQIEAYIANWHAVIAISGGVVTKQAEHCDRVIHYLAARWGMLDDIEGWKGW